MPPVPLPARIYKHYIGYIAIALAGALVIGLFWLGLSSLLSTPGIDHVLIFEIGLIAILSTLVITAVQLYVYSLSYIELNTEGVLIKNWFTLFVSKDEQFEWAKVSRSVSTQGGIFGQVLNYGTISVETEGGSILARITLIPRPEFWQSQIQQKADLGTINVTIAPTLAP